MMGSINPPPSVAPGDKHRPAARRDLAEPPTALALWPTFLRRTMADEDLRRPATPAAPPRQD